MSEHRFSHIPENTDLREFLDEKYDAYDDHMADLLSYARDFLKCWLLKEITLDNSIIFESCERITYLEDAEKAFNEENDIQYARQSLQKAFEKIR